MENKTAVKLTAKIAVKFTTLLFTENTELLLKIQHKMLAPMLPAYFAVN